MEQALDFFEKYNDLEKALYEAYPTNVEFKNNLAISYYKLYEIYLKMNQQENAKIYLLRAVGIFEELKRDIPSYAQFIQFYNIAKNALEGLAK